MRLVQKAFTHEEQLHLMEHITKLYVTCTQYVRPWQQYSKSWPIIDVILLKFQHFLTIFCFIRVHNNNIMIIMIQCKKT